MADAKQLANTARTTLAQGLEALQSGSDVPASLLDIAEPIAASMGILHRIESGKTNDAAECQQALDNVRGALDALQGVDAGIPAVDSAMEAVAGSLSKLFALNRALSEGGGGQAAKPAAAAAAPVAPGGTHYMEEPDPAVQQMAEQARMAHAATAAQVAPPQAMGLGHTVPVQDSPLAAQPAPQAAPQAAPQPAPQAAPAQHPAHTPVPAQAQQAAQAQGRQPLHIGGGAEGVPDVVAPPSDHHVPGMTDAPPPPTDARIVDVELGAHSGSNFYKGLSGNDVVDHGGIFVATYQIPKIGTPIALRFHFPGDLEFMADGIVQWTRETRSGETEPGFGAKLTRITPEGRQLVYRYVRNREPMFYDDL